MFGHILLLLVLFDNEFHRIAYGQVGEIALDVLAMEKEVVVGVFDETETAFKAEDFAYFYRVFRLRGDTLRCRRTSCGPPGCFVPAPAQSLRASQ